MVGLPSRVYKMYPHELSGGMKQRVCIAMAIALNPTVIIADESTSALDVVVQRVVAQTLIKVKDTLGVSMIMIGHDMGLMAQLVDRIAVMYAGNIVETAPVDTMFKEPLHPYSQLLIESIPTLKERKPLKITEGITHDPRDPPPGASSNCAARTLWTAVAACDRPCVNSNRGTRLRATCMTKQKTGEFAMSDQLLEIRDVTKTYGRSAKTEVVALQDFNLSIAKHPATITTVAGESGSGKTTLAKLILGFESLSSGQILFEGQDLSHMNHKQWKRIPTQRTGGVPRPLCGLQPLLSRRTRLPRDHESLSAR